MVLAKRYCVEYVDGTIECFRRDGFWFTEKGIIIKWAIFWGFFLIFMAWFVGGYMHAKSRLKKGKPLLGYHKWLVSYQERAQYGQVPQNHFTFYAAQPYGARRPDGTYPEAPPMYNGTDVPPTYFAPPGTTKVNPNQSGAMEMPMYAPPPQAHVAPQQAGVVEGAPAQGGEQSAALPPRPAQAKLAMSKLMGRFKK